MASLNRVEIHRTSWGAIQNSNIPKTAQQFVVSMSLLTKATRIGKGIGFKRPNGHSVVVFQKAAEHCSQYLSKGSLVFVEGSLSTREWQDQQGQKRYSTEIKAQRVQFLDKKDGGKSGSSFPSESSGMDNVPF